jgi:hypothetical protein
MFGWLHLRSGTQIFSEIDVMTAPFDKANRNTGLGSAIASSRFSYESLAVQSELTLGEGVERAGRLFFRLVKLTIQPPAIHLLSLEQSNPSKYPEFAISKDPVL